MLVGREHELTACGFDKYSSKYGQLLPRNIVREPTPDVLTCDVLRRIPVPSKQGRIWPNVVWRAPQVKVNASKYSRKAYQRLRALAKFRFDCICNMMASLLREVFNTDKRVLQIRVTGELPCRPLMLLLPAATGHGTGFQLICISQDDLSHALQSSVYPQTEPTPRVRVRGENFSSVLLNNVALSLHACFRSASLHVDRHPIINIHCATDMSVQTSISPSNAALWTMRIPDL